MERSYALAARYFPNGTADGREPVATSVPATVRPAEQITVVRPVTSVVSTLAVPDTLPNVPRNRAFHTAVGPDTTTPTGMIRACIAGEQRIAAGERVRLRLIDAVRVGAATLPAGSFIYGTASINGQRLALTVSSVECGGSILPVALTAYDTDGIEGIFVPDAAERKGPQRCGGEHVGRHRLRNLDNQQCRAAGGDGSYAQRLERSQSVPLLQTARSAYNAQGRAPAVTHQF